MYPQPLFHILGRSVTLYDLAWAVGVFLALPLSFRLGRERGFPPTVVLHGWAAGVVAARLLIVAGRFGQPFFGGEAGPQLGQEVILITAVVGLLGLGAALHPLTRDRPFAALDMVFPPLALFQVFVRLGCFSAGCCHGKPASGLPWAVTFHHPDTASIYRGIPVHPTQLYMAAGNLVTLSILLALRKRPSFRGALVWVYLLSYGLLRFVVEFYRGDVEPLIGIFSVSHVVSLIFIVLAVVVLTRRFLANASRLPATPSSPATG